MSDVERYQFPELLQAIASPEIFEFSSRAKESKDDAERVYNTVALDTMTVQALSEPLEFPSVMLAVLPGDRVALAVDPNIPGIATVLQSVVEYLSEAQPSGIDIVLSDEVCDSVREEIAAALAGTAELHVHRSHARVGLRYIGADAGADPVYMNRFLVDAEFVLPIVSERTCGLEGEFEHAGVFPEFADSLSRRRFGLDPKLLATLSPSDKFAMTLGVQVMLSVAADSAGRIASITAGTPQALHQYACTANHITALSETVSIVVASLDGSEQQQTWLNAARAAATASTLLENGGTIILWTRIRQSLEQGLLELTDEYDEYDDDDERALSEVDSDSDTDGRSDDQENLDSDVGPDGFPVWSNLELAARQLSAIATEYRVLLHSDLVNDSVEAIGLGVVGSVDDLRRLTQSFATCGLLRAASFATPCLNLNENQAERNQ